MCSNNLKMFDQWQGRTRGRPLGKPISSTGGQIHPGEHGVGHLPRSIDPVLDPAEDGSGSVPKERGWPTGCGCAYHFLFCDKACWRGGRPARPSALRRRGGPFRDDILRARTSTSTPETSLLPSGSPVKLQTRSRDTAARVQVCLGAHRLSCAWRIGEKSQVTQSLVRSYCSQVFMRRTCRTSTDNGETRHCGQRETVQPWCNGFREVVSAMSVLMRATMKRQKLQTSARPQDAARWIMRSRHLRREERERERGAHAEGIAASRRACHARWPQDVLRLQLGRVQQRRPRKCGPGLESALQERVPPAPRRDE